MRILCFLFLIAMAGVGVLFFRENAQELTLTFFNWSVTAPVAAIVGITYGLGMLTGWSVVGLFRRSFEGATDLSPREAARVR
jgi:uncharacterized membrane protein YciS (DUF1049 family)